MAKRSADKPMSMFARHWRAFVYVLNITRFSLFVLAAGAVLLNVDQGQDLLLSTAEDGKIFLLLGSCLLWAFSIWLWTRTLLDIRFPETPPDWSVLALWRAWMPRVLGMAPFALVALASWQAGAPADEFILPSLLVGAAFFVLVVYRRPIGRLIARVLLRGGARKSRMWTEDMASKQPIATDLRSALSHYLGKIAVVFFLAGWVLFVWGVADPLGMGNTFNAIILLMAWGATFLPVGSVLTYFANKTGLPLVTALLLLAVVSSFFNDNHTIRPLTGSTANERVSIEQALDAWAARHCRVVGGKDECGPLVVVATAGGGIRAAYWTGTVLGHLEDTIPDFHDRVFAISGVSGGSVGAAVYRSVITEIDRNGCAGRVRECSAKILSYDYLSPLSVSMLYPDMLQRFIPFPLLPDRGVTLERAWEQGVAAETRGSQMFAGSFSALGHRAENSWPVLLLNAIWTNNGRRIVAASARIDGVPEFRLANDQLTKIGYDVRLSTAAHNSARFPLVSPHGSWRRGEEGNPAAGRLRGRLQDGGLFENYGAETAFEVLELARTRLAGKSYTPVVVLISSDPALPKNLALSRRGTMSATSDEFSNTLDSIFNARVGRGAELAAKLRDWASREDRVFAYFRMCERDKKGEMTTMDDVPDKPPPLGWSLSDQAERTIRAYLIADDSEAPDAVPCRPENRASARRVCEELRIRAGITGLTCPA